MLPEKEGAEKPRFEDCRLGNADRFGPTSFPKWLMQNNFARLTRLVGFSLERFYFWSMLIPKIVRARAFTQSHLANSSGQWLLRSQDTGGAFSLHSGTMAPGAGAPLHVHTREDETFYVLAGEVEAIAGDERQTLRTGDCIFLPRGVPHRLHNVSSEPAQVLMLIQPAGLEEFFEEVERLSKNGPPQPEALRELTARFGIRPVSA
jgi:quercetin dioxygenase-like cupin family protein